MQNALKCLFVIKNSLCISQCKAFEEVVDTQMYGFSRQVTYATRLGILTNDEGHRLLSDLERELNQLYTDVYEETQEKTRLARRVKLCQTK